MPRVQQNSCDHFLMVPSARMHVFDFLLLMAELTKNVACSKTLSDKDRQTKLQLATGCTAMSARLQALMCA